MVIDLVVHKVLGKAVGSKALEDMDVDSKAVGMDVDKDHNRDLHNNSWLKQRLLQ
jgi:hypothetical protein